MHLRDQPAEVIHRLVQSGRYRIGWHAVQHMFEDGFETDDLVQALTGKIDVLDEYEDECRLLALCHFRVGRETICPLHVICDSSDEESLDVVTAYIPIRPYWVNPRQRGVRS